MGIGDLAQLCGMIDTNNDGHPISAAMAIARALTSSHHHAACAERNRAARSVTATEYLTPFPSDVDGEPSATPGTRVSLAYIAVRRAHASGFDTFTYVDGFGRALAQDQRQADGSYARHERTFDRTGRVHKAFLPRSAGDPLPNPDAFAYTTLYDALGRLVERIYPGDLTETPVGAWERWDYPNRRTAIHTDREGRSVLRQMDRDGMLTSVERFDSLNSVVATTSYSYDPQGDLESVNDGAQTWSFAVDAIGRTRLREDPAAGIFEYDYNAFGEPVIERAPGGITRILHRDMLGRVDTLQQENGVDIFTWDSAPHGKGRLASTTGSDGTIESFAYDSLGRQESITVAGIGPSRSAEFGYDAAGQLVQVVYPQVTGGFQFRVGYAYANGYLTEVTDLERQQPLWSASGRDLHGRVNAAVFGDAVLSATYGFHPVYGKLDSIEAVRPEDPGTKLLDQHLTLYRDGRVSARSDTSEDYSQALQRLETYQYDDVGRLSEWRLLGQGLQTRKDTYVYDAQMRLDHVDHFVGTSSTPISEGYQYAASSPYRVEQGADYGLGYDAQGRVKERVPVTNPLAWNAHRREMTVESYSHNNLPRAGSLGGTAYAITYTARGQRESLSVGSGSEQKETHYLGSLSEVREESGTTTYLHRVLAEGKVIAQVEVPDTAQAAQDVESVWYTVQDHLGSPAIALREGEEVPERFFNEPHGRRIAEDGTLLSPYGSHPLTEGLTGHQHDYELNLINMGGRVYDPEVGRFLSSDIFVVGALSARGADPYRYTSHDPINRWDPSGFKEEPEGANGEDYDPTNGPTPYDWDNSDGSEPTPDDGDEPTPPDPADSGANHSSNSAAGAGDAADFMAQNFSNDTGTNRVQLEPQATPATGQYSSPSWTSLLDFPYLRDDPTPSPEQPLSLDTEVDSERIPLIDWDAVPLLGAYRAGGASRPTGVPRAYAIEVSLGSFIGIGGRSAGLSFLWVDGIGWTPFFHTGFGAGIGGFGGSVSGFEVSNVSHPRDWQGDFHNVFASPGLFGANVSWWDKVFAKGGGFSTPGAGYQRQYYNPIGDLDVQRAQAGWQRAIEQLTGNNFE